LPAKALAAAAAENVLKNRPPKLLRAACPAPATGLRTEEFAKELLRVHLLPLIKPPRVKPTVVPATHATGIATHPAAFCVLKRTMTHLIVHGPLLRILQRVVCFLQFLELHSGWSCERVKSVGISIYSGE